MFLYCRTKSRSRKGPRLERVRWVEPILLLYSGRARPTHARVLNTRRQRNGPLQIRLLHKKDHSQDQRHHPSPSDQNIQEPPLLNNKRDSPEQGSAIRPCPQVYPQATQALTAASQAALEIKPFAIRAQVTWVHKTFALIMAKAEGTTRFIVLTPCVKKLNMLRPRISIRIW